MRQSRAQALTAGLVVLGAALVMLALTRKKRQLPRRLYDYSDRSGFPRPAAQMRGAAAAGYSPTAATSAAPARAHSAG